MPSALSVHIGSLDGPHPYVSSGGQSELLYRPDDPFLGITHKNYLISSITVEIHPRARFYTILEYEIFLRSSLGSSGSPGEEGMRSIPGDLIRHLRTHYLSSVRHPHTCALRRSVP